MDSFLIDYVQAHELAPVFREINFARLSDNMIDHIARSAVRILAGR